MKRLGFLLATVLVLLLLPRAASARHTFHSGIRVGVHSGHVKVFTGHGHPFGHHKFSHHRFRIHRHFRPHKFHPRFHHHALALGSLLILSEPSDARRFGPAWLGPGFVIIDATPREAQVFLDGRLLGSARQLIARAFPVSPGRHGVEIILRGFRPYRAQFTVDGGFPTRLRVALQPE